MQPLAKHYPDWKAPSEDGKLLIWPQPRDILSQTLENQNNLWAADSIFLQNVPLPHVRQRMREFVGHDEATPLIATGHQAELYHAGVWVKDALIHTVAEKLGGSGFHIAVDTDAAKHLNVRWPGESIPLSDESNLLDAPWTGLLAVPSPARLNEISARLSAASADWNFQPMLPNLLASLRRLSMESRDLPSALTNALHELDWELGLRHHALLASPLWSSEPFLLFAHDLLANAERTATHYNNALRAYRIEANIRSSTRPMPDLFTSDEAIEAPFWLDDLHTQKRFRPSVFLTDRGWLLKLLGGDEFIFEKNLDGWEAASRLQRWLASMRHRLAPRALMLTMFARLLMADQFVHGIGGARYDQVTDFFIESNYRLAPPKFSVTTATLYFPRALEHERVCVPCVEREGHRLKHDLLGQRKRELVAEIAALPRGSPQRSARFFQMHAELALAASHSASMQQWREKLRQTQESEKQEQTLFDRELFYAIQPRQRLAEMIERCAAEF
ncbi:MAG TPA: hypothetical protein VGF52_03150 [Tepidisphaeraceae bacterium]